MSEGKLTGVVRSAEEITGIPGCVSFTIKGSISYMLSMNDLAGQRIGVEETLPKSDYVGAGFVWLKNWLKDIRVAVDWANVPVDTKILVKSDGVWARRHFAHYSQIERLIYAWLDGKTSFTTTETMYWDEAELYNIEKLFDKA
ncbi:hypothetical protein KKE60_06040 [Patescibacteria group bacterium]|nr:hypothetical protein [Patescibacteria group bacterium]